MLGATVVPHRNRVRPPSEPATEIRGFDMPVKEIQQRRALGWLHTSYRVGEGRIDEQPFTVRYRMRPDHRMLRRDHLRRLFTPDVLGFVIGARKRARRI